MDKLTFGASGNEASSILPNRNIEVKPEQRNRRLQDNLNRPHAHVISGRFNNLNQILNRFLLPLERRRPHRQSPPLTVPNRFPPMFLHLLFRRRSDIIAFMLRSSGANESGENLFEVGLELLSLEKTDELRVGAIERNGRIVVV